MWASALPRLALALVAAALLLAACDGGDSAEPTTPTTTTDTGDSTTPAAGERRDVRVYLVRGDRVGVARRTVTATPGVLRAALTELLAGPTAEEEGWGLTSAVPDGVEVLGVDLADGTATVDLSGAFDDGGGSLSMFLRLAQLVHTATQFPTVERVALHLDGEPVTTFSAEGIELPKTLTRADVEEQAPAILVESPAPGDEVTSPLRVRGTANTFEATVEVELVGAAGEQLDSTFGTATCGTGCRGAFSIDVEFDGAGQATLRAFERSAKDGSETKVVEVPVQLR
ncbi:MAG: Gmad2 immunoglobulin-like domain-containing protein [Gaiella sp.]